MSRKYWPLRRTSRQQLLVGPVPNAKAVKMMQPLQHGNTQARIAEVVGSLPVHDVWLEVRLSRGWIAAYRLGITGAGNKQKTAILELRVFPDEPNRAPGEWSAQFFGMRSSAPRPFSWSLLKELQRGHAEQLIEQQLDGIRKQGAERAFFGISVPRGPARGRKGGRAPNLAFYGAFADRYREVETQLRRMEGFVSTRKYLAHEHQKPETTIASWIRRCRQLGLLDATSEGKRGG